MTELTALSQIWDYLKLNQALEKADCIIAFGSFDILVAELAADLYFRGYAKHVLMTGGLGKGTLGRWAKPEGEIFAEAARKKGVPESALLIENKATNTGENIAFSKALLRQSGIEARKIIGVQKPFMERRLYASLKKQWAGVECVVTSPDMGMQEYFSVIIKTGMPRDELIKIMLGDFARVQTYAELGYQIAQEIPGEVWEAYNFLAGIYGSI